MTPPVSNPTKPPCKSSFITGKSQVNHHSHPFTTGKSPLKHTALQNVLLSPSTFLDLFKSTFLPNFCWFFPSDVVTIALGHFVSDVGIFPGLWQHAHSSRRWDHDNRAACLRSTPLNTVEVVSFPVGNAYAPETGLEDERSFPIGSMYGIFTYIWLILMVVSNPIEKD